MNGEVGSYFEGQLVICVFGVVLLSFCCWLDEYIGFLVVWQWLLVGKKILMDLVICLVMFLWFIVVIGILLVVMY